MADGFLFRRPITIVASEVSNPASGPLIDFPVLVNATLPGLGAASQASGADLVFTDADGVLLDSEVELFEADRLVAWVKVPSLSNAADTRLFLNYGHPTPPSTNPEQVWDAYKAVWHLGQDPASAGAGDIRDSTANDKDGTAAVSMSTNDLVDGQIGRALKFEDADNSFVRVPSPINVGTGFTLSAWINVDLAANNIVTVFSNSNSGLEIDGFRLFVNNQNSSNGRLFFETSSGGPLSDNAAFTGTGVVPFGTWAHVAVVVDRTAGTARLFVNAVDLTSDQTITTTFNIDSTHTIGRMGDEFSFEGMIDEVEIASAKLPAEWIQTTVANQKSDSTFLTIGPEEAVR